VRALLLVDIQNDFMPFGALPVTDGDAVVPVANALIPRFGLVVATQDWHPANHGSFASAHDNARVGDLVLLGEIDQLLWPDHCVQGMPGASFHSALDVAGIDRVVRKGTDPRIDSYSGFFDNGHKRATGLGDFLESHAVADVVVLGLATDFCVRATALDAVGLGFGVTLVTDGCRAVNADPGSGERAVAEMRAAGVKLVESAHV